MSQSSKDHYLENKVLTAPPEQLRLMLIEAALRFARRAKLHRGEGKDERACETLIRAQNVVAELLGALDRRIDPKLVDKVAAIYMFVFRNLVETVTEYDEKKLDNAIRVLELEKETWKQVCEKKGEQKRSIGSPHFPTTHTEKPLDVAPNASFSFEA